MARERRTAPRAKRARPRAEIAGERRVVRRRASRERTGESDERRARHPLASSAKLQASRDREPARQPDRERITVNVPREVAEQLRDAVHATPGMTVGAFVSRCVSELVARLEEERGAKFPRRLGRLPAGRPRRSDHER